MLGNLPRLFCNHRIVVAPNILVVADLGVEAPLAGLPWDFQANYQQPSAVDAGTIQLENWFGEKRRRRAKTINFPMRLHVNRYK
ncbi:MAG: hypothetical protein ACKO2G_15225 [Verrucomicrobiales bacterium]